MLPIPVIRFANRICQPTESRLQQSLPQCHRRIQRHAVEGDLPGL